MKVVPFSSSKKKQGRDALRDMTGVEYGRVENTQNIKLVVYAKASHIFGMTLATCTFGVFNNWNKGLTGGMGPIVISTVTTGAGFVILAMCMSELSSAIPFSGGCYGFARVTCGLRFSFLAAVTELLDLVITTSLCVLSVTDYLTTMFNLNPNLHLVVGGATYTLMLLYMSYGGTSTWKVVLYGSIFVLIVIVLHILIGCIYGNIEKNGFENGDDPSIPNHAYFIGGIPSIFNAFGVAMWWYSGIECIPYAAEETHEPEKNIPIGLMSAMLVYYPLVIATLMSTIAMSPGMIELSGLYYPLNPGFQMIFKQMTDAGAAGLQFLCVLLPLVPFMYSYGRLFYSLSRVGFIPEIFSRTLPSTGAPFIAMFVGSLLGFCVLTILLWSNSAIVLKMIFQIYVISCSFTFFFVFAAYIMLKINHEHMPRYFKLPRYLGIGLAVVGFGIFTMTFISSCYSGRETIFYSFIFMIFWYAISSVYYSLFSQNNIKLSEDEEYVLIMNLNVNMMLQAEFGYEYILVHCEEEHNQESILCLNELRKIMQAQNFSKEIITYFCNKYILESSQLQVNISSQMLNRFKSILSSWPTDIAIALLMYDLDHELVLIIDKDIMPRLKKKREYLRKFFSNKSVYAVDTTEVKSKSKSSGTGIITNLWNSNTNNVPSNERRFSLEMLSKMKSDPSLNNDPSNKSHDPSNKNDIESSQHVDDVVVFM